MRRSDPGIQLKMWTTPPSEEVINVASVPQRSPFRYPGGKTWLVPRIRQWLRSLGQRPSVLIEPFAGGGIVGLTAGFEALADHVVFVELDQQVAAVWQTILGGEAAWLADRILSFEMTLDHARAVLAAKAGNTREQAFQTILKNRTFHGGILAPGATFIKHGENGKGLQSRWYAETLARRIEAIGQLRDRFTASKPCWSTQASSGPSSLSIRPIRQVAQTASGQAHACMFTTSSTTSDSLPRRSKSRGMCCSPMTTRRRCESSPRGTPSQWRASR